MVVEVGAGDGRRVKEVAVGKGEDGEGGVGGGGWAGEAAVGLSS